MAAAEHFRALTLLLQSAKYSDLTLCCGDREFAVHRAIVCPHSPFFDAVCGGTFKVSTEHSRQNFRIRTDAAPQEASSRRIELKDDDPETVERMISFMYSLDYQDERQGETEAPGSTEVEDSNTGNSDATAPSDEREVLTETGVNNGGGNVPHQENDHPALFSSVRVYAIADKYNVPFLKDLAKHRFDIWARWNWACADFLAIIREVFSSTPSSDRGLRDIVFVIVADHPDFFVHKDEFRDLVEDIGELGLGMLDKLITRHTEEKSALLSQIQSLEAEIGTSRFLLGNSEQALTRKSSELDEKMSKVNNLNVCRHCHEDFNIEVEDHFLPGRAIIRCKKCRTRH